MGGQNPGCQVEEGGISKLAFPCPFSKLPGGTVWTSGFMRTLSCVYAPVKSGCVNRMWVPAAGPARTMEENKEPAYRDCCFS